MVEYGLITLHRGNKTLLEMRGGGRGAGVWVRHLSGWTSSPAVRANGRVARPSMGSLPIPTTYDGKVLTLTGWADCRTSFETEVLAEQIANIFPYDPRSQLEPMRLYVQHHGVDRWATVELDGQVTAEADCVTKRVEISIPLIVPDGLKYGLPVVSRGSWGAGSSGGLEHPLYDRTGHLEYSGVQTGHRVHMPNAGLEPTWPILRVIGTTSWVRFTCNGQAVQLNAQTDGLTIDCATGACTSQGVDVSGYLTRDDFFEIPPGGATVSFQASNPADFEVEASPAWL